MTRTRLSAAAALTALTLGLPWAYVDAGVLSTILGPNRAVGRSDAFLVSEAPVRVLIVGALAALIIGAVHRRTPTTCRIVRAGVLALAAAFALALAAGAIPVVVCLLAALALTVPLVWRLPARGSRGPADPRLARPR